MLLDLRQHSLTNLINGRITDFQGPALLFWNNRTFSDADFANLCKFGGETKLEDRKKVGKFGLGFNAIYNLTDLPLFVSRTSLCILDPHEKFFITNSGQSGGKQFDLNRRENGNFFRDKICGQLEPFVGIQNFEVSEDRIDYSGTLFRFPLRNREHVGWSDISKKVYTPEDALHLIDMTAKSAPLFLMFLQHVNKFEIRIRETTEMQFRTVASVSRSFIGSNSTMSRVLMAAPDKFDRDYKIVINDDIKKRLYEWDIFVCAPGIKSVLDGTPCVGGIAFPSHDLKLQSNTDRQLLFCFLPLPNPHSTGLPFLVNGSFAVSPSRRHLELESADDRSHQRSIEGRWNHDILEKAVVPALRNALLSKARTHTQEQLFNLFPDANGQVDVFCLSILKLFYSQLATDINLRLFSKSYGASDRFLSLQDSGVCLISDDVPYHIHDSVLACNSMVPDVHLISLPAKIMTALRLYEKSVYNNKRLNLSRILSYWQFEKFASCLPATQRHYCRVLKFILESPIDKSMRSILYREKWVLVDLDNSVEKMMKKPCDLVKPGSDVSQLLHFTKMFTPSQVMAIDENGYDSMCLKLGLNDKYLPISAVDALKKNLNRIGNSAQHKVVLKQYFGHIEMNQQHYQATVGIKLFSNLMLQIG